MQAEERSAAPISGPTVFRRVGLRGWQHVHRRGSVPHLRGGESDHGRDDRHGRRRRDGLGHEGGVCLPGGIALYESGSPIGQNGAVNVTDQVALWDAGTEVDRQPGLGDNQAPRQSGADTGPDENGSIVEVVDTDGDGMLEDSGYEYPAVEDVVRVTVSGEPDEPSVYGDIGLVERLLSNLIDNALTNTRAGGTVTVQLDETNGAAGVQVEDTGIGIPEDELPLVTQRFYRVDRDGEASDGGSGLGLAITAEIAELHDTELVIESQEEEGTTVTIRFPRNGSSDGTRPPEQ